MSTRVILSKTDEPESANFEQNLAVILMVPERARQLLERMALVKELKRKDKDVYSIEYWGGMAEYVVKRKLGDVVLEIHPDGEPEPVRILGLLRAGIPVDRDLMPVEDPGRVLEAAMAAYDEEAEGAADDTKFDCYTVVVDDDSVKFTALAEYGTGEGIRTRSLYEKHLRWLAGETVELDEKIEAPRQ